MPLSLALIFSIFCGVLLPWQTTSQESGLKHLIIDSDFLSFPDDAGAIALANIFEQQGKVRILGIASDVNSRYSVPAIDAINTYYGHPDIPLAQNRTVNNSTAEPEVDPSVTPEFITVVGNSSLFPEAIHDGSNSTIIPPVKFYHELLSSAEDNSVTIISIGFFTNLGELYHSKGGFDLIDRKVAQLVVEGGNFASSPHAPSDIGYNLGNSFDAAKVLVDWPSPVTYLGDDVGVLVLAGSVLENTPVSNPVRTVYDIFLNGTGLNNPSWDVMTTYFSVMGIEEGSFQYGNEGGKIQIFDNGTAGWDYTAVVPDSRRQHFLELRESNVTIAKKLNDLLVVPPSS